MQMSISAALRGAAALVLALAATLAAAQSANLLPQPALDLLENGTVLAVEHLADGSTIVGGIFDRIGGVRRENLARLLPDGTVDPAWNPAPGGGVQAIVADGAGNLYIGGDFRNVGAATRHYVAKIRADGTGEVAPWDADADGTVLVLALDGAGSVYAGGRFDNIGGQARRRLAKLSAETGESDALWAPSTATSGSDVIDIRALVIADGALYTGGYYTRIGGLERRNLARISTSGAGVVDEQWNPSPDGLVQALALRNNVLYAGGYFGQAGGRTQIRLAKLDATGIGAADANWNPVPTLDNAVFIEMKALALDADGNVYAAGLFSGIDGQARQNIAKLSGSTGAPVATWNPGTDGIVFALDVDATGAALIGGRFLHVSDEQAWGYAAVTPDGTLVGRHNAQYPGRVFAIAPLPGGGAIVGGEFESANGQPRGNLLRLQPDGTLDPAWKPATDDYVRALAVSANAVYVGGAFEHVDGKARSRLVKLDGAAGTVDPVWAPDPDNTVSALAVADGALFAGGYFWNVGPREVRYLAKLPLTGNAQADAVWNPAPDSDVSTLLSDGQGELYVGGAFSTIGGAAKPRLARISTSGSGVAATAWTPFDTQSSYGVCGLVLGPSDTLYVAGRFTEAGGLPRDGAARVSTNGTGTADPAWNPQIVGYGSDLAAPCAIAVDRTGMVYLGGIFTLAGGLERSGLARVSPANGTVDESWNPAPDRYVAALAMLADGSILAGGEFSTIGSTPRGGLAAFGDAEQIFANGFETD